MRGDDMVQSVRYLCKVPVVDLAAKLQDASLFNKYNWRKDKYAHSDMEDIWVRYNHPSNIGDAFNDEHDSVWYPVLEDIPEVLPIVFGLMAAVGGERLGGVLITKLPAGGSIKPHIDEGWHAGYYSKYFVPIQNDDGAVFCWDGLELNPLAGEVYEFDNSVLHWVENRSNRDRIAMIVCIKPFGGGRIGSA